MLYNKPKISEFCERGVSAVQFCRPSHFDVRKIFDCGQCFRFDEVKNTRHDAEFSGMAHGKYISVAEDKDFLYIYNSTAEEFEEIWFHYLSLDRDYCEINRDILSLSENTELRRAIDVSSGIRILAQDPWEALCSFIISQNNNIPRIKGLVRSLCRACSAPVELPEGMYPHVCEAHLDDMGNFCHFPSPDEVAALGAERLFALKTGFRAKYIYDAAIKVRDSIIDLEYLQNCPDSTECADILCGIRGVGPKVAACTLLFGFSKLDSFPIDVWIKRVLAKYFSEDFDTASLGEYAGVAQQYLFYYERYVNAKDT